VKNRLVRLWTDHLKCRFVSCAEHADLDSLRALLLEMSAFNYERFLLNLSRCRLQKNWVVLFHLFALPEGVVCQSALSIEQTRFNVGTRHVDLLLGQDSLAVGDACTFFQVVV
jgi:hypothetical protein